MRKEKLNFIKYELKSYRQNKKFLQEKDRHCQGNCRHVFWLEYMLSSIEDALDLLPEEIQEYARLHYFEASCKRPEHIAQTLNVSTRTIARWDRELMETVSERAGIISAGY